ncbi:RsmB/NOP family class I SAM-dependent RNA methyltransferase [Shewanella avicenniae]|uniref:RsmB/NOP family class I SAM-dependent RNA methyltransferase n=1 Tax=Shewanella avicenniae TaxID=2814294 RepID=A0ABX7QPU0_9GAMM|nr:RsmB/NOP family class I SAM-dependent RNA methyltransferase [Shewanella avicenniae]QSX32878.1 RsmB/NOP family class I SAM-dependent RNA methyltransferase [Shewanella avicenniae]
MTPIEKRAFSYASTIIALFDEVLATKKNADRVIADYFRANKKHGAKDRRIIRETLFGLFRWWGWLQRIPAQPEATQQLRLQQLYFTAKLEQHPWQDISDAWASLAEFAAPSCTIVDVQSGCAWLNQLFAEGEFTAEQLVPAWLWPLLPKDFSEQEALIDALCQRPPIWARAQQIDRDVAVTQLRALEIDAASGPFADTLSLGHKSLNLQQVELYQTGKLEIQDLASQVIGQVCQPQPAQRWWDACCGAGGKSLQLASLMVQNGAGDGQIVASDIRPAAMNELAKRASRAGFNNIHLQAWHNDELPVSAASFDGVLVDAPCSCTGTWRRNPDQRWLDTEDTVHESAQLQLSILTKAAAAVALNGSLVYATCSITDVENQQLVSAFLANHPQFEIVELTHPFNGAQTKFLTIWPFDANSDGMFVAKMRRIS